MIVGTLHLSHKTGELTALPGVFTLDSGDQIPKSATCHVSQILPPVFLTHIATLLSNPWDESLSGEGVHTDFLLTLRNNNVQTVTCNDIQVSAAAPLWTNPTDSCKKLSQGFNSGE